jgi:uncharacterized SAM-binding protein YcdF (DUF218 family)/lysophospholipase L1-like esterase
VPLRTPRFIAGEILAPVALGIKAKPRGWMRSPFVRGIVAGVIIVLVGRFLINSTMVADRMLMPLLLTDTAGTGDVLVVMGAGVVGACTPNLNAVRRVLLGARLWREKRAPIMMFTGGSGPPGCPVGDVMARLAREVGVPESAMIVETRSRTTKENADQSAPILRARGARRLVVVTDRLHMKRAAGVFRHAGFTVERVAVPVFEGHTDNVSMLIAGVRELSALVYYNLRGWVADPSSSLTSDTQPSSGAPPQDLAQQQRNAMHVKLAHPDGPILIIGASYAGGWKLDSLAGVQVINRGVSGQQSFEVLNRFDQEVMALRPRLVIIWGFINDIFRGASADSASTLARVRQSHIRMVELARQHRIEPVLATEVTVRPNDSWLERTASWAGALLGKEGYQARVNRLVLETDRWLEGYARNEGILLLDLQSVLAERGGARKREFMNEDGSHISEAGYAALTAYATPILEKHIAARANAAIP